MRLLPPVLNRLLSSPTIHRRSFHHAYLQAKGPEPAIFENSLEKTLEVHRIANRSSIIRKVVSPPDQQKSSALPVEKSAEFESPRQTSQVKVPKSSKGAGKASGAPRTLRSHTRTSPYRPVDWKTNAQNGKSEQCPWLTELDSRRTFTGGISQLDVEVRALEIYLTPTKQEEETVERVVTEATKLLREIVPHPPQIIGSRRTGFAMSHSDLDIMLPVPDSVRSIDSIRKPSATRPTVVRQYRKLLHQVENALQQSPSYNSRVHLSNGRHKVLNATHKPTNLHLQFYCGEDLPASIEYTQDFHAEYPSLRPLYMATRLILERKGLFGSTQSSLTPSALQMLVAAFLKMNHGRFKRDNGYGEPLLAFLHTFGTEKDLTSTGIAVDPPGFFNAESVKEASAMYDPDDLPAHLRGQRALVNMKKSAAVRRNEPLATQLCLQDPANYMNDLGRSCSRTLELQSAFADAHRRLKLALDSWDPSEPCIPSRSILNSVLHANFEDFESRRASIGAG